MDFPLTDRFALIAHQDSTHALHRFAGTLAHNA
jgi:hypothetical protein